MKFLRAIEQNCFNTKLFRKVASKKRKHHKICERKRRKRQIASLSKLMNEMFMNAFVNWHRVFGVLFCAISHFSKEGHGVRRLSASIPYYRSTLGRKNRTFLGLCLVVCIFVFVWANERYGKYLLSGFFEYCSV